MVPPHSEPRKGRANLAIRVEACGGVMLRTGVKTKSTEADPKHLAAQKTPPVDNSNPINPKK